MTLIVPRPQDTIHKAWLLRLLTAIADEPSVVRDVRFKGGTCAAMRGFLHRFSVDLDLDFDYVGAQEDVSKLRVTLENVYADLGLMVKDSSKVVPQYFLQYPIKDGRNTIKVEITTLAPKANTYEPARFVDIDRILQCHTIETMFANKLVALLDRHERHGSIAGRDVYDIHHFFLQGFRYDPAIIIERRGTSADDFLQKLIAFVDEKITQTIIDQDLNALLPLEDFRRIRHVLKQEVMMFLRDERARIGAE